MKRILFLILLVVQNLYSQNNYPQDYFSNPLDIELILNGNFGELRGSHFHSGLDFKTKFKEGLTVYSAADGYISRISIKHGGFGKALYIDHPNGYTTVYAHLKNFSEEIENYIKKIQYEKKTFQIDHYLKKNILPVRKNEDIGKSGNTGSSFGPHLHFETRRTKDQKALNPKLFNFKINDSRHPTINSVYLYQIDSLKNPTVPLKLNIKKINDSLYVSEKISLNGRVGFGITGFDRQDLAPNKNGIYRFSSFYNNKKSIDFNFDSFYFQESIKIKTLIDYMFYVKNKRRIIKLFKDKGNDLSIYTNQGNGFIQIEDKESEFLIEISDMKRNTTKVIIPIIKGNNINKLNQSQKLTDFNTKIVDEMDYNFDYGESSIQISKNSFLKDVELLIESNNDTIKIINPYVPLFKNIRISLLNKNQKKGNYLVNKNFDGDESFASVKMDKNNKFTVKTKSLGTYYIKNDSIKPSIKPLNFKDGDWISTKKIIKFKIKDNESGIKKYNVKINGKWILFEYEYKKDELFYEFDSYFENNTKNEIEISVEDMVGNESKKTYTFFRN